jgi:4-aminobutyrate aminotransferase-like enzyme
VTTHRCAQSGVLSRHGILLVADEVQTGFGRTGSMFAVDWLDEGCVKPDILVMAKGIANGFPLSAIATRSDLSVHQPPGMIRVVGCCYWTN